MSKRNMGLRSDEMPAFLRSLLAKVHTSVTSTPGQKNTAKREDKSSVYVKERDYYAALEKYLSATLRPCTTDEENAHEESAGDVRRSPPDVREDPIAASQMDELETYHLQRVMRVGWLFDHENHARHSYYPSNVFPLGSNDEYAFFTRAWTRNVNYPYAKRLYDRGGRFAAILKHVASDECPCAFLTAFNVGNNDVWVGRDSDSGRAVPLARLAVDNELLFRSEFFNRRNPNRLFINTNAWIYETFVRPYYGKYGCTHPRDTRTFVTANGRTIPVDATRFGLGTTTDASAGTSTKGGTDDKSKKHETVQAVDNRLVRSDVTSRKTASVHGGYRRREESERTDSAPSGHRNDDGKLYGEQSDGDVDTTVDVRDIDDDGRVTTDLREKTRDRSSPLPTERRDRMVRVLNSLYFGRNATREEDNNGALGFDDRILVRCEDYRSFLYSPLLKATSCRHEEEDVSFVQRRCGDEIATELRKCKRCGRVKAM